MARFRGHLQPRVGSEQIRFELYDRLNGVEIVVHHLGSQPLFGPNREGMAFSMIGSSFHWTTQFDLLGLSFLTAEEALLMRPPNPAATDWRIIIPYWMPITLMMIVPAFAATRLMLHRRRFKPGQCPKCGYDLRATPDRCPECGLEVAPAAQVS